MDRFSPATAQWFDGAFPEATSAQLGAWEAISRGENTLVIAPTGSGKTLSAFLWAIDVLAQRGPAEPGEVRGTSVLYVSPLKALAVDVERNLRAPLVGVTQTAKRLGLDPPEISVGVRSGDTPAAQRRAMQRTPPDILITTPESLFLLLTSAARETLAQVGTVIVDEVHAIAGTKRGAHLALSLARLDQLTERPAQRIGLSATVRPPEEVGRFLVGAAPITIVRPPAPKTFDLSVRVPVADMTDPGDSEQPGSIWPHVDEAIVDLVLAHRSSIVFANSRRLAERLTARLNEAYTARLGEPVDTEHKPPAQLGPSTEVIHGAEHLLARAHHGSVSKEQRAIIEDDLKTGRLRCVVATSSLELGIDMGAVDLVVQVEAPPSVASGLQRVGRAGHQVGEISRGVLFPKHRTDVIHCTVAAQRMLSGQIELLQIPAHPLDILAQQTVAACALEPLDVDGWFDVVRSTGSYAQLPRSAYESVLDLLAGRYPSDEFAELRPRVVWDRDAGTLTGRPGAQRLAVTSGGAIPDRGMFAVFMVGEKGSRVGELDEEMVYESRVGDVFALGATSWRIEEITFDRVLVSPAFGLPGRLPFWHGDGLGRPAELGAALGEFVRTAGQVSADELTAIVAGLDPVHTQPDPAHTQPGTGHAQPGTAHTQPDTGHAQPDTGPARAPDGGPHAHGADTSSVGTSGKAGAGAKARPKGAQSPAETDLDTAARPDVAGRGNDAEAGAKPHATGADERSGAATVEAVPDTATTTVETKPDTATTTVEAKPDTTIVEAQPNTATVEAKPDTTTVEAQPNTATVEAVPGTATVEAVPGTATVATGGGSGAKSRDGVRGRAGVKGKAAFGELSKSGARLDQLVRTAGLDQNATANLVGLLEEQRTATGQLPTDRTLVVERFRDELGDWRLVLHSPYGTPVHAPWALAVGARLQERFGIDAAPTASDDGIVVRLPDTTDDPPGAELFAFEPDEIDDIVTEQVGGSALFASRFRECAARALLLPRRDPGKRAPLWQQRQRSAQLLDVARKFPQFPILLETVRECLRDVYDLPSLRALLTRVARREVRLIEVETASPSPFANALLFSYIGQFLYDGDSPLAERRAAALALDSSLLAELLGRVELRELLSPEVITRTEHELQRRTPDRRARDPEGLADLLRLLGPLTPLEAAARCVPRTALPAHSEHADTDAAHPDHRTKATAQFAAATDPSNAIEDGETGAGTAVDPNDDARRSERGSDAGPDPTVDPDDDAEPLERGGDAGSSTTVDPNGDAGRFERGDDTGSGPTVDPNGDARRLGRGGDAGPGTAVDADDNAERAARVGAADRAAHGVGSAEGAPGIVDLLGESDAPAWFAELRAARRALEVSFAGRTWWVAVEDAARLRDALGVPLPIGVPAAFIEPVPDPLGDLVGRYARTHAPFTTADVAARFGLGTAVATTALHRLLAEKRVVEGEFTPDTAGTEWCDTQVLRRLRRRSLAAARHEVEPVPTAAFGRFLPAWQHVGSGELRGIDGVATVVEQLAGVPIPASAWESLILPQRVRDYTPAMLDELMATGEVIWSGHGAITARDGWIALHLADQAPFTLPPPDDIDPTDTQLDLLIALGAALEPRPTTSTPAPSRSTGPATKQPPPPDATSPPTGTRAPGTETPPPNATLQDRQPIDLDTPDLESPTTARTTNTPPQADEARDNQRGTAATNEARDNQRGEATGASRTRPVSAEPANAGIEPDSPRRLPPTLHGGGAYFFRQLADSTGLLDDKAVGEALWQLVWAGYVSGDTFAPVRALLSGTARSTTAHRTPRRAPRGRAYLPRAAMPTRSGPPNLTGRWSILPERVLDNTLRAHATADQLIERYGIVTKGSVQNEGVPGGFALMYRVLTEFEDRGRCRRGYFVDTLGGAQFSTTDTVDRLRSFDTDRDSTRSTVAVAMAACDPANPFGAALPWPKGDAEGGHRPGRKAGALVVLVGGELVLYLERGGKTLLSFTEDPGLRRIAADALAGLVRDRRVDSLVIDKINGETVHGNPFVDYLVEAGFAVTPRGLRLRGQG